MSTNPNSEEVEDTTKDEKKKKRNLIQTKVVIRRLPPGMTESQFVEIISPLPEHDYFRYVTGNKVLAPNNYCRAYINFVNVEDIIDFRDKYDGMEFENKATKNGHKLYCVIEYAPFQKTPKKGRKREDAKVNTIEEDPDYQKFLETLETENDKEVLDVEKYLDELELRDKQNHNSAETPLTAFIKQRREERKKIREERKKQDNDRRKKKDEERRKKRDAERKKRIELEKNKKKSRELSSGNEIDGKKTLGETKRDMIELEKAKKDQELKTKEDDKVKILQKDLGNSKATTKNQWLKGGVYSHLELEQNWTEEYSKTFPELGSTPNHNETEYAVFTGQSENSEPKREFSGRIKDGKFKSSREFYQRKWKDEAVNNKSVESEKGEGKFKPKLKPERENYRPSSPRGRGRGYRPSTGGRGTRPQKYSEQRSRTARKSEGDK